MGDKDKVIVICVKPGGKKLTNGKLYLAKLDPQNGGMCYRVYDDACNWGTYYRNRFIEINNILEE